MKYIKLYLTIIFTLTLVSSGCLSVAQNVIIDTYYAKEYRKCLKLCNKNIKKETKLQQMGYLYKSLLYAEKFKKYPEAIQLLHTIKELPKFAVFYKKNKGVFIKIQKLILAEFDNKLQIDEQLPHIKSLAELYLNEFEFSYSAGTGDYYSKLKIKKPIEKYKKYRWLLKYLLHLNTVIPENGKTEVLQETLILISVLGLSNTENFNKPMGNEIYFYLKNKKYLSDEHTELVQETLEIYTQKYAQQKKYEYRKIGNPNIFKSDIRYKLIYDRIDKISKEDEESVPKLSAYLTKGFNEAEKVYSIYHYIETNIVYTADSTSEMSVNTYKKQSDYADKTVRENQAADIVLQNKAGVCEGYASLFTALCKVANISSEFVSGEVTQSIKILGSHAWNIVEIDSCWYNIDVTWGDIKYFLSDPVFFNQSHFSSLGTQLLYCPYSEKDFYDNVNSYAEKLNVVTKEDSTSLMNLSYSYFSAGEYQKSIKSYEYYGTKFEKGFDYYFWLGEAYYMTSEHEKALPLLKKSLEIKPRNLTTILVIAKINRILERYPESQKHLDLAHKIAPNDSRVKRAFALQFYGVKNVNRAIKIADSLISAQPKDIDNYKLRAQIYNAEKEYDKAIQMYKDILIRTPDHKVTIQNLANCYINAEDYVNAIKTLDQLLEINPNDYFGLSYQSFIYLHLKKYEMAYDNLAILVSKRPNSEYNQSQYAWACILTGRYAKAISSAKKAIHINNETSAWNSLTLGYIYTNQFDKAKEIYTSQKDKKYTDDGESATYGEFFKKWLTYLQNEGKGHRDFAEALNLLE